MVLLASCDLEKSKTFNGKLVLPNEDKKSPDRVLLNVVVDGENCDDVFTGLSGAEKCVTFIGERKATYCPSNLSGNVFNQYSLEDLKNGKISSVLGIVDLVKLPDDYSDMRSLLGYCKEYPSVRFIGGNLLNIEGVRVGRYGFADGKAPCVFKDMYDTFLEVDLNDLSGLQEKVKKARSKAEKLKKESKSSGKKRGSGEKKPKEKKPVKRVEAFNSMFGGSEEDF